MKTANGKRAGFMGHKKIKASIAGVLLIMANSAMSTGLVHPDDPRPQPEPTVIVVPFGQAEIEQSSSISTSGLLGLVGIAADLAVGAAASSSDEQQRKKLVDHAGEVDYQVVFAQKIADGLNKCHMRADVGGHLPVPTKKLSSNETVSGDSYKSDPQHRFLVESRLAVVAVQKMLFGTKLCVYGFAKAFKTKDLSPIGVYKGSNGTNFCKDDLNHYSDTDPEKIPEFRKVMDLALTKAGSGIAEQLCKH
ncbi:MAG: hypothetical protein ACOYBR_00740 [Fluviibacter sp.]